MTPPSNRPLGRAFFSAPTLDLARALLGQRLVRVVDGFRTSGLIVETEAYVGEEDLACHAARGRTARNAVMYGPPGHAYVYFIYGMYHCLNIVTEKQDFPAAVLIRALAPAEGIRIQAERRRLRGRLELEMERRASRNSAPAIPGGTRPGPVLRSLLGGPGRLCQALAIDRELNGESLRGDRLFLERGATSSRILTTPRIGVSYAGPWRRKPWRFLVADSPWVSVRPRGAAERRRRRLAGA